MIFEADHLPNLPAGTHIILVEDLYGCRDVDTIQLHEPAVLSDSLIVTQVTCYGFNNGSATVYPIGGTAPYSFAWNTTPAQTTAAAINLPAGTFSLTVTDTNGCEVSDLITISEPPLLTGVTSATHNNCFGDSFGTAAISAAGGVPPYSYTWTTNPVQYTAAASGLPAGNYQVLLLDTVGCEVFETVTITEPAAFITIINPSPDNGSCSGAANVSIMGGTAPYQPQWSNGADTTAITGLCPGWYILTVTDSLGCTTTDSTFIMQVNDIPAITADPFSLYPNPATTSITITYKTAGRLVITDMLGRLQQSVVLPQRSEELTVDISGLMSGVYNYAYITTVGRKTGKVVVVR